MHGRLRDEIVGKEEVGKLGDTKKVGVYVRPTVIRTESRKQIEPKNINIDSGVPDHFNDSQSHKPEISIGTDSRMRISEIRGESDAVLEKVMQREGLMYHQ